MKHLLLVAVTALSLLTSGCFGDRELTRALAIDQLQQTTTYGGPFEIDTSQLPPNAVTVRESEDNGGPITSITLDAKYSVRIVLVPSTRPARLAVPGK
jgi:hypothetical protein